MARKLLSRLLTVLGLLTLCLGATSSSCSLNNSSGGGGSNPSFVADLTIQDSNGNTTDTFIRDTQITLILTVRNRLDTVATVDFTTDRTVDFVIVRENSDTVVWQWSKDQPPFNTTATVLTFAPGEIKTFTRTWDQRDNDGTLVRAGGYEARGALVYDGFDDSPLRTNQMASTLERFTIN